MNAPLRGRLPRPLSLLEVLPLAREDLEKLREPRARTLAQRFREPHHLIARLLSKGLGQMEVARAVGYSVARIIQLEADPAFRNLLATYRAQVTEKIDEEFDATLDLMAQNMLRAERTIADHFDKAEDEGELVPLKTALLIRADSADRVGYGKRQMNVNVNVDFAANLEKARARSARVIDHQRAPASAPEAPAPEAAEPLASRSAPPQGFSRRALG